MISKVRFEWCVHYKCNYRCPYCFFNNNWDKVAKYNKYLPIGEWIKSWHRIYEIYGSTHIMTIGGEPIIYPSFVELVGELSKEHTIQIITNLSCDINILINLVRHSNSIRLDMDFSFHPTFAKFETFLEKALFLKKEGVPNKIIYIAYPPQLKQMGYFKEKFEQKGFCFVVRPFIGKYQGIIYPDNYTEEEKNMINKFSHNFSKEQKKCVGNLVIPEKTKGRLCRAGQKYAWIEPDGGVYRCGPHIGLMGNFFNENFRLLDKPLSCEKETCPCGHKLFVDKE